jgi:hypothetical protein
MSCYPLLEQTLLLQLLYLVIVCLNVLLTAVAAVEVARHRSRVGDKLAIHAQRFNRHWRLQR